MAPTIKLVKSEPNGKIDIMILIDHASDHLSAECTRLGYTSIGARSYKIHCGTAAEVDAARNPLRKFFT